MSFFRLDPLWLALVLWSAPWVVALIHPYGPHVWARGPQERRVLALAAGVALLAALCAAGAGLIARAVRRRGAERDRGLALVAVWVASALVFPLRSAARAHGLPSDAGFAAALGGALALGAAAALLLGALCTRASPGRAGRVLLAACALCAVVWISSLAAALGLDALDARLLALGGFALAAALLTARGLGLRVLPSPGRLAGAAVLLALVAPPLVVSVRPRIEAEPAPAAARGDAMHVLLVVVDTLRADHTGPGGHFLPTTPTLDRLVRSRSTWFASATSPASATVPSMKALFTGRPASWFGYDEAKDPPPAGSWTLARAFRRAGYRTAGFSLNGLVDGEGFRAGFEDFWSAGGWLHYRRTGLLHALLDGGQHWEGMRRAERWRLHTQDGEVARTMARRWLARDDGRPFFLYVHTVDPHWPWYDRGHGLIHPELRDLPRRLSHVDLLRLPKGAADNRRLRATRELRELIGRYDEEIRHADRVVAGLLEDLEAAGYGDSTMVVLIGDHGEEFFEHDGFSHGHDVFEEQVRVPLWIRWPARGARFAGMPLRVADPVSTRDLFATLVDYAQLGAQPASVGDSLRPWLEGREPEAIRPIISESFSGGALHGAYREGSVKVRIAYAPELSPAQSRDVRVFDLESDPAERRPLVPGPGLSPVVARARAHLARLWVRGSDASGPDPAERARPATSPVDDAALERLRALGYVD